MHQLRMRLTMISAVKVVAVAMTPVVTNLLHGGSHWADPNVRGRTGKGITLNKGMAAST